MAANLRDLKVWQEAVALAGDIARAARASTKRETKVLTDRLLLTSLGIAEKIAGAHVLYTSSEQRVVYRSAKQDLLTLETQMAVARHADLLPAAAQSNMLDHVQLLNRLLAGYLVYLERQISEEAKENDKTSMTPNAD